MFTATPAVPLEPTVVAPTPRMVMPVEPVRVPEWKLGTANCRSLTLTMPRRSRFAPDRAVTPAGMDCTDSDRFWAVTTSSPTWVADALATWASAAHDAADAATPMVTAEAHNIHRNETPSLRPPQILA